MQKIDTVIPIIGVNEEGNLKTETELILKDVIYYGNSTDI